MITFLPFQFLAYIKKLGITLSLTIIALTVFSQNEPDLSVRFIRRLPVINYVQNSTNPSIEGWPIAGQTIQWRAHVKNWSANNYTNVSYSWKKNGNVLKTGSLTFTPYSDVTAVFDDIWAFQRDSITFSIDDAKVISEISEANNSLQIYTNALSANFYVEQSLYDYFHTYQKDLGVQTNSWDDWMQMLQVKRWNLMFQNAIFPEAPNGVLDRIRVDSIIIVPDKSLPLVAGGLATNSPNLNDRTVDLQWGFPYNETLKNMYLNHTNATDDNPFFYEGSLLHELGHARYLIDLYGFDIKTSQVQIKEGNIPIAGSALMPIRAWDVVYYNKWQSFMSGEYTKVSLYEVLALNKIANRRAVCGNYNAPCNIGQFINDLPQNNTLKITDADNNILSNACVEIYRAASGSDWYGKNFDDIPDLNFTTNSNGEVNVGRNPFSNGSLVHTFGNSNMDIIIRVEKNDRVGYAVIEAADFNVEYMKGNISNAIYTVNLNMVSCSDFSGSTCNCIIAPPTALTRGADVNMNVSNPYIELRGQVNANGSPTTVSFQYGNSTAYNRTGGSPQSPVTGNTTISVRSHFLFLTQANVLYHYRVVAQNSAGTAFGEDSTVFIPPHRPNPPAVRNPTHTTLSVSIDFASINVGSTDYVIQETTTGKYVQADGSLGTNLTFTGSKTVSGLTPNTTYTFRVGAISKGDGSITYGPSASATTTRPPTLTTRVPGSITTNSAELMGDVRTYEQPVSVYFYYGKTTNYGSSIFAGSFTSNSSGSIAKVVTGLEPNQLYHYRLNSSSNFENTFGNDVAFYTLANTPTAPIVSNPTFSTITIAVGVADGNPSYTSYAIEETATNKFVQADGSLGSAPVFQSASTWGNKTITGLASGTTYTFKVKPRNESGVETAFGPSASGTTLSSQPAITNYYPKTGSSDLAITSNWTTDPAGGAGSSPANFTSPNQLFTINANGDGSLKQQWTISGGSNVLLQRQLVVEPPNGRIIVGSGSTFDFNNNNVFIRSNVSGTASIGVITGTITNAVNVVIERFIPARRAWRMINTPSATSGSVKAAWQEGGTTPSSNPNPLPGFGTHITGGSVEQGFDQSPSNGSSIKTYDNATDNWLPLSNTNATPVNSNVFMLFVRGDRSIDLSKGTAAAPTNTVLRAFGPLRIGNQTFAVNSTGFTPIPNPYPSAINFATITRDNVQNSFYVWDPKLSGADGVGAFVNVSFNGSSYDVTPTPASPITEHIQSHQSFLVRSLGNGAPGSLVIRETDKSTGGSDNVFRTSSVSQNLRVDLMVNDINNTSSVADGVLASYNPDFSNAINDMDALKMANFNENLGIVRNGETLTVDRRSAIVANDTVFLKLWNTQQKSYRLQFNPANISSSIAAYLLDNYLHTSTPVSTNSLSNIDFTITGDAASAAVDRFMILFKANSTLPVQFTTVKAYQQSANVQVDWHVATEANIISYEVEKSSNGLMFTKVGTVAARANNNAAVSYNWIDVAPYVGNNYYRIKAVASTGEVRYTQVINVKTAKGKIEITAYPNPIAGRTINVQLVNQQAGTYTVELVNSIGQVIYRSLIKHLGGSSSQTLNFGKKLAKGIYQLNIGNGDRKKAIQVISN